MKAISPELKGVSIMGSSISGLYTGTNEKSQNYSSGGYHVDKSMLKHDKEKGTYKEDGYSKNPTAIYINDAIVDGKIVVDGKVANGQFTYVVDTNGNLIIGRRNGSVKFQTPHPSLIGGKDPIVKMAGMVDIRNGKIHSWDDRSGHFKPNIKSMKYADEAFGKLSKEIFVKDFNKGKK